MSTSAEPSKLPEKPAEGKSLFDYVKDAVPLVVALLSIGFNIYQYIENRGLDREKKALENVKTGLESEKIKTETEKARLENQASQINLSKQIAENDVQIDADYLYFSGNAMLALSPDKQKNDFVNNEVWQGLQPWLEKWGAGEPVIVEGSGTKKVHGALILRVRNRGKVEAKEILLDFKGFKCFVKGDSLAEPSELAQNLPE